MSKINYIKNDGGPVLGCSESAGVKIIHQDGYAFKDLARAGELLPFEDWRLDPEKRAEDLAGRLSIEEIAGLMVYTSHQATPNRGNTPFPATYGGKDFEESGAEPWAVTDQQKEYIHDRHIRHMLDTVFDSAEVAARWSNALQELCEAEPFGIPMNNSTDPRHGSDSSKEFNMGSGREVSLWPESPGIAATFDPEVAKTFGSIAGRELRALGITTALFPQIDLGTEPRWGRFSCTYGVSPQLVTDMAKACCEGLQTSLGDSEIKDGWGTDSINAMAKHWPGGGTGEGGRDAHFAFGKYAVYPGGNMKDHLKPFTEGAFKLEGGTKCASAIMPYYTISYGQDTKNGENVGNGFSKYLINDLLRGEYGYDGVVCTDWAIVDDMGEKISDFRGKCWGVETLTQPERHYKALMAGCDQFGGSFDVESILAAYKMGCDEHGADFMDKRMRQSAKRLLLNIFRLGLFENPYLDVEKTKATVKCEEFQKTGYEIQVRSQILLKNKGNVLPIAEGKKVYVPQREVPAGLDWFGKPTEAYKVYPMPKESIEKYYVVTDDPAEADFALVFMNSPDCNLGQNGYSDDDLAAGGNGYVPSSLQYAPYTANTAREVSVAGGDPLESFTNRSYRGKTHQATNSSELTRLQDAAKAMNGKPVVTVMRFDNPAVPGEWEPLSDAIVGNSGTGAEAILDIVSGRREPSGLLPFQLPKNMETVEAHCEDVPFDMECYTDSQGNTYDFAYGLNWSGVISDHRTAKYKPQK